MTTVVMRLVLAMLLFPAAGAVFFILLFAITGRGGPPAVSHLLALWGAIDLFVAAYWVGVWRGVVRWTRRRVVWTLAAAIWSLAAGGALAVMCMALNRLLPIQIAVLAAGGIGPIVWVLSTVLLWRETPRERMERLCALGARAVTCPVCGYSMIGLREARCPECGMAFTLEQLLATQPRAEAGMSEL